MASPAFDPATAVNPRRAFDAGTGARSAVVGLISAWRRAAPQSPALPRHALIELNEA